MRTGSISVPLSAQKWVEKKHNKRAPFWIRITQFHDSQCLSTPVSRTPPTVRPHHWTCTASIHLDLFACVFSFVITCCYCCEELCILCKCEYQNYKVEACGWVQNESEPSINGYVLIMGLLVSFHKMLNKFKLKLFFKSKFSLDIKNKSASATFTWSIVILEFVSVFWTTLLKAAEHLGEGFPKCCQERL